MLANSLKSVTKIKSSLSDLNLELLRKRLLERYGGILVLLALIVTASLMSDVFLTSRNILNVLRQVSANGIISLGLLFVILSGGIDISVGSIVGVVSVTFGVLFDPMSSVPPFNGLIRFLSSLMPATPGLELAVALLILLAIGAFLGFINGLVICKANIQPFIMTIGTLTLYRGIALLIPNGRPVYMHAETVNKVNFIGEARILDIPIPVYILLAIGILAAFLLNNTTYGRYVRAIGGNQEATRVAGINVDRHKMIAYTLSGITAAIASIVITSRTTTGEPNLGVSFEMDAIAACVIGGARLNGGIGSVLGTIIGAIIIGVINNMLNLINVSAYYQYVVRGTIIILAVVLRSAKRSR